MAKKDSTVQNVISLVDDLAVLVKKGFDHVDDQLSTIKSDMQADFHHVNERINDIKTEMQKTQEMIRDMSILNRQIGLDLIPYRR